VPPRRREEPERTRMERTVKITPRVAAQVARRLRLAASGRSRSMPAMVNDALDEALPSLEEIRMQLTLPAAEAAAAGISPDLRLGPELRTARHGQASLRPGQHFPAQPQHRPNGLKRRGAVRPAQEGAVTRPAKLPPSGGGGVRGPFLAAPHLHGAGESFRSRPPADGTWGGTGTPGWAGGHGGFAGRSRLGPDRPIRGSGAGIAVIRLAGHRCAARWVGSPP